MKRMILTVAVFFVCAGLSQVNPPKIVSFLQIKNTTGLTLKVKVYFLYTNPETDTEERIFPCEPEVHLNDQNVRWRRVKVDLFPALPNINKLKLKGASLKKVENTIGPYLDVEAIDQGVVMVKPILKKRVMSAGVYVITKVSEQTVQVKEKPIQEVTIEVVIQ